MKGLTFSQKLIFIDCESAEASLVGRGDTGTDVIGAIFAGAALKLKDGILDIYEEIGCSERRSWRQIDKVAMNFKEVGSATAWLWLPEDPRSEEMITESRIRWVEVTKSSWNYPYTPEEEGLLYLKKKK